MKIIRTIYHKTRRLIANTPPLPTELFTFPLGLTLVLLFPPAVAWIAVAALLTLSMLLLWCMGALWVNRSVVGRSLFVLLLWGGLFLLSPEDVMEHPLGAQALLLISYLISSIVVAAYRWAKEYLMKGQGLCIRGRILRVERLRFERILVLSSLAGLLF